MSTVQKELDVGAALLGLYEGLPYVKKLGYRVGEWGDHILVRAIIDDDCGFGEFFARVMEAAGKSEEFEDMLPPDLKSAYDVVPILTDAGEGAMRHFRTMIPVIDK